jgi:hypothetical protein
MRHLELAAAFILILSAASAHPQSAIATPTLSHPSGALAPGTAVIARDTTPEAIIYYTVDGSTPSYETNPRNHLAYPTGTTMQYRPVDYPEGFLIYGPKTIKLLAAKPGMADSAVASYSYPLTPPSGTPLSACKTLSAGTKYYLTRDVSSPGTCMISGGDGWTLNLNGHTIIYGTAKRARVSSNAAVANGTATVTCASCSFTPDIVGDEAFIDDASQNFDETTVASWVNAHTITLASASHWTTPRNNLNIWTAKAVHAIDCDARIAKGCKNATIYNGAITQSANINPRSSAVHIGADNDWGDNGRNTISDLRININSQDSIGIEINYGSFGDHIQFNTITDTSTTLYERDHLVGYPIKLLGAYNSNRRTDPLQYISDNTCLGSPQGCIESDDSSAIINNYAHLGPTQFVGGYCVFASSAGVVIRGNSCSGNTRGVEFEASDFLADSNIINTQDSGAVHDPGHNPVGCEIGGNYGIRIKDYVGSGTQITKGLIKNNQVTVTQAACPAQAIRLTQITATDTILIDRNDFHLVMTAPSDQWSSIYSADQSDGSGTTYSNNTYAITGRNSSQGYAAFIDYEGVRNWTVPSLISPAIFFRTGTTNSSGAFSGQGKPTLRCAQGGNATFAAKWNGAPLSCQ